MAFIDRNRRADRSSRQAIGMDRFIERECPFCGSTDINIEQNHEPGTLFSQIFVICTNCGAQTRKRKVVAGQDMEPILKEIAELWNTRRRKPVKKEAADEKGTDT